jgi:enterochelin esterase-like enzyme
VGRIPNRHVADTRLSAVYVPPGFTAHRRYPVVYLLHGLPGSPSSYYASLDIANVADSIGAGSHQPFIAVIPVGGPRRHATDGEWAGVWDDYLTQDVIPWADRNLPTLPNRRARALAGLCAGGYGAMNTGLRHPRLFGTLEAWEGYFAPVFRDGPFAHATPAVLAANNPTLLVRKHASLLRKLGTRFYVAVGGNHGDVLRVWSLRYAALLTTLRLPHRLWLLPAAEATSGDRWRPRR